jgi:polyisoprenoid-binding protein YceI
MVDNCHASEVAKGFYPRGLCGQMLRPLLELSMRIILATVLVLTATISAAQNPTTPGSKNPAAVSGGVYTVDPDHTLVVWTVDHLGFTPYTGIFGDVTGSLTLDPSRLESTKVDITIPVSKVTTASAGLTQHLLRPGKDRAKPDFFGGSPADARFVSTKVVASGDRAKLTGNLTFNGVTRPVVLDVSFYGAGKLSAQMGGKENIGFHATGTIQRSQFGLGFGVPMVGDEVKLDIAAAFAK